MFVQTSAAANRFANMPCSMRLHALASLHAVQRQLVRALCIHCIGYSRTWRHIEAQHMPQAWHASFSVCFTCIASLPANTVYTYACPHWTSTYFVQQTQA